MMQNLIYIGLGGAAGSMLRYLLQVPLNSTRFPFGTLLVNITGCLVIGALWAYFSKNAPGENLRMLLMTGFCGGFTTFSAFTMEGIQMLTQGRMMPFIIYTTVSVAGGLLATFAGYKLVQ